jgi:hypothetical protein
MAALPTIHVVNGTGVRAVGGFLGYPVFLPRVHATGAHRVIMKPRDASGAEVELGRDGDSWTFASCEFRGRWVVQADGEDGSQLGRLQLDFVSTPAHSEFREPTIAQCERLLVEGTRQDVQSVLPKLPCFSTDGEQRPFPGDGFVYLGPAVGAFSMDPASEFDWKADLRTRTLSFVGDPASPTPPSQIVMGPSAARMWRKCFKEFDIAPMPERAQATYAAYRQLVAARGLVRHEADCRRPRISSVHSTPAPVEMPNEGVEHFATGLAAAAATRHGIDEPELFHILECAFGRLDWSVKWDIVRSWAEAGVLEPTTDARWPARRYFARRPRLIFTDATKRQAVIAGLLTPAVRERVENLAHEKGLRVRQERSLSSWSPWLLAITDATRLESTLERQENFAPSEFVPILDDAATPVNMIVLGSPRALLNESDAGTAARVWSPDSRCFRAGTVHPSSVTVRLVQRPREPDRYEVMRDGRPIWWTPSRTWAFLAATNLCRENPFVIESGLVVVPARSAVRLPLALARALAFRGASSGPRRTGEYAYGFPDRATALATLARLLPDVALPTE